MKQGKVNGLPHTIEGNPDTADGIRHHLVRDHTGEVVAIKTTWQNYRPEETLPRAVQAYKLRRMWNL